MRTLRMAAGAAAMLVTFAGLAATAAASASAQTTGFDGTIAATAGRRQVCAFAVDDATLPAARLGCRTVDVFPAGVPMGWIDSVTAPVGAIEVRGWAGDADNDGPTGVHVYVDGAFAGGVAADLPRADVAAAHLALGGSTGFRVQLVNQYGPRTVCAFALNNDGPHRPLGCRQVVVAPGLDPEGWVDAIDVDGHSIKVRGWAFDRDRDGAVPVQLSIGGVEATTVMADQPRPDVEAIAGTGPNTGFNARVSVPRGVYEVCVRALNNNGPHRVLRCQTVVVGLLPAPIGELDYAFWWQGQLDIVGWAAIEGLADDVDVHAYVDGRFVGGVRAGETRRDVRVAPLTDHTVGFRLSVPADRTTGHHVCVYAISADGNHPLLGCQTVPPDRADSPCPTFDVVQERGTFLLPSTPRAGETVTFCGIGERILGGRNCTGVDPYVITIGELFVPMTSPFPIPTSCRFRVTGQVPVGHPPGLFTIQVRPDDRQDRRLYFWSAMVVAP